MYYPLFSEPSGPVVLVTGGAGYIGSHTCLELLSEGYRVVVVDNFDNSNIEALLRVQRLAGLGLHVIECDLRDEALLEVAFARFRPEFVVHFAGLKAVGESVAQPLRYYSNNLDSTLSLLRMMERHGVSELVFSSSACVYGDPDAVPVREDAALRPSNPYGRTKMYIEGMIADWSRASGGSAVLLRYFNPIAAHPSGEIGEDPLGIPNNLMPMMAQVATGRQPLLHIFGTDWPTPDGTGVRDYLHVVDLARGHVAALRYLREKRAATPVSTFNLGTGQGHSVREMLQCLREASGMPIEVLEVERRPGDVAELYGDVALAERELNWKATLGLQEMCRDTWNWCAKNPLGYRN